MSKYSCPKCGGNLYILSEHVYDKEQNIDPQTGKLKKRIVREYGGDCQTLIHIQCRDCDFSFNENNDDYPEVMELLENSTRDENYSINEYDQDWWNKHT